MSIRLMIVDDHQIFIDGMKALLQTVTGLEVVGSACGADEAIAKVKECDPNVVLMDIQMPNKDGIEATREILKSSPSVKIIGLTSANESIYIKKMLEAGAMGYILKNIDKDELINVIHKVYKGEKHLDSAVTSELIKNYSDKTANPTDLLSKLTKREKEVLILIAQGLTDKEIAEKVFLSPLTVITHRKNLLSKLNLSNKVELARFAMEHKLLD